MNSTCIMNQMYYVNSALIYQPIRNSRCVCVCGNAIESLNYTFVWLIWIKWERNNHFNAVLHKLNNFLCKVIWFFSRAFFFLSFPSQFQHIFSFVFRCFFFFCFVAIMKLLFLHQWDNCWREHSWKRKDQTNQQRQTKVVWYLSPYNVHFNWLEAWHMCQVLCSLADRDTLCCFTQFASKLLFSVLSLVERRHWLFPFISTQAMDYRPTSPTKPRQNAT